MTARTRSADVVTYVYCVVRSKTVPAARRVPGGVPGAGRVRVVGIGDDLWLVVSDAPLARYGDEAIRHGLEDLRWVSAVAMAHESVVERFASADAVAPLKLFTLFATDERAVRAMRRGRRRLERLLDHVAGREEWGVRVTLDEARAPSHAGRKGTLAAYALSGTRFLLRKKAERDVKSRVRETARRAAAELYERLVRDADDARRREPGAVEAATLLLDAAFLVPKSRARAFRATAARATRRVAAGCRVTLTGPWPPYNFVGARA